MPTVRRPRAKSASRTRERHGPSVHPKQVRFATRHGQRSFLKLYILVTCPPQNVSNAPVRVPTRSNPTTRPNLPPYSRPPSHTAHGRPHPVAHRGTRKSTDRHPGVQRVQGRSPRTPTPPPLHLPLPGCVYSMVHLVVLKWRLSSTPCCSANLAAWFGCWKP